MCILVYRLCIEYVFYVYCMCIEGVLYFYRAAVLYFKLLLKERRGKSV